MQACGLWYSWGMYSTAHQDPYFAQGIAMSTVLTQAQRKALYSFWQHHHIEYSYSNYCQFRRKASLVAMPFYRKPVLFFDSPYGVYAINSDGKIYDGS